MPVKVLGQETALPVECPLHSNYVAGKRLRSLQHIRIKGIFTKNLVCIACFWKDAMETGSSGYLWGRWSGCQRSRGGKEVSAHSIPFHSLEF